MTYYKIKSITNGLGKRDINKNKVLDIEYTEKLELKIYKLPAGGELYISCASLPISLHKLRLKKLVHIVEISKKDFDIKSKDGAIKKPKPIKKDNKTSKKTTTKKITTSKKTTTKKIDSKDDTKESN